MGIVTAQGQAARRGLRLFPGKGDTGMKRIKSKLGLALFTCLALAAKFTEQNRLATVRDFHKTASDKLGDLRISFWNPWNNSG